MSRGWHITNVILSLLIWPYGLLYLVLYISARIDYNHRIAEAWQAIQDYYTTLGV